MKPKHVKVIKQFVDRPELLDIHSYTGYMGGVVLRFRSSSLPFINDVLHFCDQHGIEVSSKFNHSLGNTEIFIISEDDVYSLKGKS